MNPVLINQPNLQNENIEKMAFKGLTNSSDIHIQSILYGKYHKKVDILSNCSHFLIFLVSLIFCVHIVYVHSQKQYYTHILTQTKNTQAKSKTLTQIYKHTHTDTSLTQCTQILSLPFTR